MIKVIVGVIVVGLVIFGGSAVLVTWAFDHDEKNANTACAALGATPTYTYRTHYICVTSDGRVVP